MRKNGKENQKGQALMEFILIVPILLIILMAMIDFGNIIYQKYTLENNLDDIIDLYKNKEHTQIKTYTQDHNLTFHHQNKTITITKNIKVNTPILNNILKNPYQIKTERTISE